ncbi:unnamed protein product, partial [Adineta steineri]
MANIDEHICYHTATGQTIQLGGTIPYVGNFQAPFNNQIGVTVPPIDNERRGVPPTDEDGLGSVTSDE